MKDIAAVVAAAATTRGIGCCGQLVSLNHSHSIFFDSIFQTILK